ncbi:MAG: ParB/RepB/Spo0J family partition protein [Clostridia bacterium]|nr:ParB/RepB/Spo0J family partition protein [Clostridia bacterium]
MSKKGLGKGLSALLPTGAGTNYDDSLDTATKIPANNIMPNQFQPRKYFDRESLEELAQSIKEHGIVQPLAVRKKGDKYELIAGERRLRAAKIAGLTEVPAVVLELEDRQMAEVSLIENVQREDLNPIEEAFSYHKLINEFNITQEELAKRVGKSRPYIANLVRLVNLPDEIQQMVRDEELTAGHARCLLGIGDETKQVIFAEQIILKHLSVRQTEKLIKAMLEREEDKGKREKKDKANLVKSPLILELEDQFRQVLGTKVLINQAGEKKGKIEIEYYSDDELTRIFEAIVNKAN